MLRRGVHQDFDAFVAARSTSLLRTAYLLGGSAQRADGLLDAALAQVWATWDRSELGPELTARAGLVRASGSWRHRSRGSGTEVDSKVDLVARLQELPHRQRAALVLHDLDGLDAEDVAHVLDCTESVARHLADRGRARLGLEDPGRELAVAADTLDAVERTPRQRRERVVQLVDVRRSRRRAETVASLVAATAAAIGVIAVWPTGTSPDRAAPAPAPQSMVDPPPLLVGHQLQAVVKEGGEDYAYDRSETTPAGGLLLRVAVAPESRPQLAQWSSSSGIPGDIELTLDGTLVRKSRPGTFESGLLLSAHEGHLLTVRSTRGTSATRLGIALYQQTPSR